MLLSVEDWRSPLLKNILTFLIHTTYFVIFNPPSSLNETPSFFFKNHIQNISINKLKLSTIFFGGSQDLNSEPYIYHASFLPTELSWRGQTLQFINTSVFLSLKKETPVWNFFNFQQFSSSHLNLNIIWPICKLDSRFSLFFLSLF